MGSPETPHAPEQRELTAEQHEVFTDLAAARDALARAENYAKILDRYPVDALVGMLVPGMTDAMLSFGSSAYLLRQSVRAGLGKTEMAKIIGLQIADAAIGVLPGIGDIADYFFKANNMSLTYFKQRVAELEQQLASLDNS